MTLLTPVLFTSFALSLLHPALAGETRPLSDAIGNGMTPVIYGEVQDTRCESYQVDEEGNLLSRFVSDFTIWEVVQAGEGGDVLVAGETIELFWGRREWSPVAEPGGCESPPWSALPQSVKAVALYLDEGVTYVNPWYEGSGGFETTAGVGELPACGEDLQQEVIDALLEAEDTNGPRDGRDPLDSGAPESAADEEEPSGSASGQKGGCSVTGTFAASPVLWGLLLAGTARRRQS